MCNKVKKVKRALHSFFLMLLATSLIACGGGGSSGDNGGGTVINKPNPSSIAASSIEDQLSSAPASSNASSQSFSSLSSARSSEAYARSSRMNSSISTSSSTSSTIQLSLYRVSETEITVVWDSSYNDYLPKNSENTIHYVVERDNSVVALVDHPGLVFVDQGLQPASSYAYTVTIIDSKGSERQTSDTLLVNTLALAHSSVTSSSSSSLSSIRTNSSISSEAKNSSNTSQALGSASSRSSLSNSVTSSFSSINSSINSSYKNENPSSSSESSRTAASSTSSLASSSQNSSGVSSSLAISSTSSTPSSSSSSKSGQTVTITWDHPKQRENGTYLELDEIAGYEIRYRKPTDTRYTYIVINSNKVREYTTSNPEQGTEFEIAVFDKNGLYSRFSKVSP